jgi:hypothetical protein
VPGATTIVSAAVAALEDADAAHITFTNLTNATLHECVRAVVSRKTQASLKSPLPFGTVPVNRESV